MARMLWLEAYDYAVALLRSGEDPWRQPDSIGLFCDEAIKLLGADYLLLPLAPLLERYLSDAGDDGEARAEALDEAIGEGELLETIGRAMTALAVSAGADKVVSVLPGPAAIGGDDEDALDIASMALGDILRAVMAIQSEIVGMDEPERAELAESGSLFRIADHAGCTITLLGHADFEHATYCFPSAETVSPFGKGGCQTMASAGFAGDTTPDPSAEHVRVQIAADAPPEFVLKRLSSLRAMEA
ncbi:hypothetical protein [Sphingopyxis sp. BSNA05]|uniref:hypothetical protein n=1 Tax=Sphingopyxis sp. BSNA05 TaxID=1236614 RepID=UPI001565851A|nr:hypothetical protein [Sphingopyxis sp. BSNA05]